MKDTYEAELNQGLKQALIDKDGWLAHYYGSQLYHLQLQREASERRRKELQRRMDEIKEQCQARSDLLRFKLGI